MRSGRRVVVAAGALAVGLFLAGCSSSSSSSGGLTGKVNKHGTKTVSGGTVEVEADDFYFNPTFIKAKPGTKLTLEIKNEGKVQHTFTSVKLGVDQTIDPDKTVSVSITVPKSGSAQFHCNFHQTMGMQGAVEASG